MLRADKINQIEQLTETFGSVPHIFLTRFSGLSAAQSDVLRAKIRSVGGSYRIIKNRLAKRAAVGTGLEQVSGQLTGPVAIAYHQDDPVGLAKALMDFAGDHPKLEVFAGVIDSSQVMDADSVKQLSKLPGLLELRAQILAMINTPATMLVRLMGTPATQVVRVLDSNREKQENDS
ncbi:MAG: 50S ribosomal protein L10 [Acidobacteria bacterium]|uniref:Large ribosomal subunit protein uL10 n=1 Tax=Candidatus Polarisedimenticola svalbardensis TaxID=2886004 RepID=A0A8J6XWL4_9BACT|nr:50S ribosomal protein L10 [Candidatus Polarisedimenticola svalbardensis]